MNQAKIVKLLRKEFGHHEVTVFTASAKNKAGILDTEIAYRGQSWWVEIKIFPDKLSTMQKKFVERHHWRAFVLIYDPKFDGFTLGNQYNPNNIICKNNEIYRIKKMFDKLI